jgi:hypothetical protein
MAVCGPPHPIGGDAGPGEVESGQCGIPPGSPLHYSGGGRGEGRRFSYLLESHILRSWPVVRLNVQLCSYVPDKKT